MGNVIKIFKMAVKYQSCADEFVDLLETLHNLSKEGKIPTEDKRSVCMKKYWNLLKAIEKAS
tara:strand:+ start:296 stop:481 length:186 start_codon:yes stop_codon:yes gene_type:complete